MKINWLAYNFGALFIPLISSFRFHGLKQIIYIMFCIIVSNILYIIIILTIKLYNKFVKKH